MLDFQDDSFIDSFEKKYNKPGKFIILQEKIDSARFLDDFLSLIKRTHRFNQYALIKLDNPFLPFLTIQENLLIEVPDEIDKEMLIERWLNLFELPIQLLHQSPIHLSSIDCLKLQLIHEMLLSKKFILLPDVSTVCSIHELQDLLRILKSAAKTSATTIILTTNNEKILSSSYHPN